MKMTQEHVDAAKTCIGLDTRKPKKKNGKLFYKTDNELYEVEGNTKEYALFTDLLNAGYCGRWMGSRGRARFNLTEDGIRWLSEETGITITERKSKD